MGGAVRDMDAEVRPSLKEVEEKQVDAHGRHLTGADMCFQEGLYNTLVVDEKVDCGVVDHVVMCA